MNELTLLNVFLIAMCIVCVMVLVWAIAVVIDDIKKHRD